MTDVVAWAALVVSVMNTAVILHTRSSVVRWTDTIRGRLS